MDWKNKLYFGDNLGILREHVATESVDLIYLDPPFNSSATYNVLFKEKSGEESAAQITAFEDTWQWSQDTDAVYLRGRSCRDSEQTSLTLNSVAVIMLSCRLDGNMAQRDQLSLIPVIKTTFRIPKETHRRLKIRAIQEGRQMADIVVDAIETYLSSRRTSSPDTLPGR